MSLPDPDEMFRRHQAEHDAEVAKAERERIIKLLEKRIDETPSELTKPSDFWRGVTSELSAIYALIKGENK